MELPFNGEKAKQLIEFAEYHAEFSACAVHSGW
jgi:hypothetical protein